MENNIVSEEVSVAHFQTAECVELASAQGLQLPKQACQDSPQCPESPVNEYPSLMAAFRHANTSLCTSEPMSNKLKTAVQAFAKVDPTELPAEVRTDLGHAVGAMEKAAVGDFSGVASQYQRLVKTNLGDATSHRIFFTIWNRLEERMQLCVLLCRINTRILELLQISRSRPFIECLVARLGVKSYPEEIVASRLHAVEIIASAGQRPHVLFADFLEMGPDSSIDSSTAGGLLFDSFGDLFLDYMPSVERVFPNVADWLAKRSLLNRTSIRFLTAAHVQAHDLCGHSVPFSLAHPNRLAAIPALRAHLEELYADAQAMWICTASQTRSFLTNVLSEQELNAIPVINAMKNLTYYAKKAASDHDARCAWVMFGYFRKSGLIRRLNNRHGELFFDIDLLPKVSNQLLDDLLDVEYSIGQGVAAYESACRQFNERFGYENPLNREWEIPDELGHLLLEA
ncbi:MAG TPA: hypothetical protein VNY51_13330 [Candidatus Dormibacteraeota bacterium]|jgi:hypothetical protein|nr:hypothetical protein [Candidatus Dormibacteraeota bacterium]